jgi:hypothetical protein
MAEPLRSLEEIEKLYPNEWVLVDMPNPKNLRPDRVTHGHLVMHTRDRDEIDRLLESLKPGEMPFIAVLYNGPPILEEYELPAEEVVPEQAG